MLYDFARWVDAVEPSVTSRMADIAARLEYEGEDIVNLSTADPDFSTPPNVCRAAIEGLERGETSYPPTPGLPELREAIATKLSEENSVETESERVYVTPGSKYALLESIMTILREGDEAVIFEPAWISYEAIIKIAGGQISTVPLDADRDFSPDLERLKATVTDDTRLIVLNTPGNPTGSVFSEEDMETIRDLAIDHDCWVVSDEVYEKIVFEGEHRSIGSLPGMAERTVTVNGFSKGYAMTGWRVGYFTGPPEFIDAASTLQSHSVTSTAIFAQRGAIEALEGPQGPFEEMYEAYEERRDVVVDHLREAGIEPPVPRAGLSAFLPIGTTDDVAFSENLLEEEYVATTPGTPFGREGYIRICITAEKDRVDTGMERIIEHIDQ